MMYNNNFYSPFQTQGYAQVPQKPKNTNPLTKEQAAELRQKGGGLSLVPTKEETLQAICTHRDLNTGESRLVTNDDGTVTCTICGSTFSTMEVDNEQVKDATNVIVDILENTKALYLDIPEQVCADYMRIIPLVKKIPALYKVASDNFKQYEGINPMQMEGSNNLFARYNMLTGPVGPQYNYGQPAMYVQPAPQQVQYQPMYGQVPSMDQPVMQPYYTPQQMQMTMEAPVGNPFYGQPQQPAPAQAPAAPQFTNINNAATAEAPKAPAQENIEVTKQFNV